MGGPAIHSLDRLRENGLDDGKFESSWFFDQVPLASHFAGPDKREDLAFFADMEPFEVPIPDFDETEMQLAVSDRMEKMAFDETILEYRNVFYPFALPVPAKTSDNLSCGLENRG